MAITFQKQPLKYQAFNRDSVQLIQELAPESIDVICIDPPYKYLKKQKLEVDFDELKFFTEAKRVLTKDGFIIMFGRGVSFYRMNCILCDLGFNFKEEIVWDKSQGSSPLMCLTRVHETISIFCKGRAGINKVKVPYLEMKKHNIDGVIQDVNRLKAVFNNPKSLEAVNIFLQENRLVNTSVSVLSPSISSGITLADRQVSTIQSMLYGLNEKSIIRTDRVHSSNFTKHGVTSDNRKTGDRCVNIAQSVEFGLTEKSIIKQVRDHYTSIHPTQKPVRLLERLILLCLPKKPKEDILVADFFGGSFSTAEACINLGVRTLICEIDKEYFDVGNERINKLILKDLY